MKNTLKLKNIFFDTETTSLNPGQIGELSYIIEGAQGIEESGNIFFKVDSVDEGAQKVHGFSVDDFDRLSNGITFKDRHIEMHDLFKDKRLVAHNVPFDIKFISSELWRCGISFQPLDRVCTMDFFKRVLKIPARSKRYGPYKNPKLSEVIDYYGLDTLKIAIYSEELFGTSERGQGYHDSRFDTAAMYVVTNVYRGLSSGNTDWLNTFKK